MTTTILAVIALSGSLVPGVNAGIQAQTDYGVALKVAATEKRPMAVLIGKGNSFSQLMSDRNLTTEAKKLLNEKYVCVVVNTDTASGKELASQFDLTNGGLVISSTGGAYQALRQSGTVTATELSRHVAAYANATATPVTTVTAGVPTTTYGTVAPASYYTPAFGGYSFGTPGCTSFG